MFKKICSTVSALRLRLPKRVLSIVAFALISATVFCITCLSVNTVSVKDGNRTVTFKTVFSATDKLLKLAAVNCSPMDEVNVKKDGDSICLTVSRAFPVKITYNNKKFSIHLTGGTVADAIKKAGIQLNGYDVVNLSLNTALTCASNIDIVHIDYVTEKSTVSIPFDSDVVYSSEVVGTHTKTNGQKGVKEVIYKKKLVNGTVAEKTVVSENVIKEPVAQTVVVGIKKKPAAVSTDIDCISRLAPSAPIELDANGNPINYKKHVSVQATAYTAAPGKHCATGVVAQCGYIAVNPKVIPYGTKMFIKTADGKYIYGYAVAADTGGFARKRPTNVDLYFSTKSECVNFGRRTVEIFFL